MPITGVDHQPTISCQGQRFDLHHYSTSALYGLSFVFTFYILHYRIPTIHKYSQEVTKFLINHKRNKEASYLLQKAIQTMNLVHLMYRGTDKSLARPISWCTLFDGENISFDASIVIYTYTGCHRRNGPNFGMVFLMLRYTDITQNTYIQSWTVTEIMAREVWNFDSCYTLIDCQIHIETGRNMWFL